MALDAAVGTFNAGIRNVPEAIADIDGSITSEKISQSAAALIVKIKLCRLFMGL